MSNVAAIAVGGAPGSARKVLRLASGLRRPTRPIPIHGQRPAADVHGGRGVFGLRFAVNFLISLHKSLSPQQIAASIER